MKVVYHEDFNQSYSYDPAAAIGRMEAVVRAIKGRVTFVEAIPAREKDIAAIHTRNHVEQVKREGVHDIAALAAGGAIQAAMIGMTEPCFALIRPPGHHASSDSAWGFCYYNNMAIALEKLKKEGAIQSAQVLDFDLHFGDGTVNILAGKGYVSIHNPSEATRNGYLKSVEHFLAQGEADVIGVSAGFDNHQEDWGGLLMTEDYRQMGEMVKGAATKNRAGYFALLEGGYNHQVLGRNVLALLEGME